MKRKNIFLSLPAILALGTTLSADWSLISDFNSEAELDKVMDVTNQVDSGAASTIVDGKWSANPGNVLEATSNLFAMLDLGVDLKAESLATSAPVTVYLEVTQPTVPDGLGGTRKAIVDAVWGLSNSDPDEVTTTTYNSFNAMQRINFGNDSYETRDINGEGSGAYFTIGQFTENVTYKIWMVVDYNLNVLQSYIQGGTEYPTQTQVTGFDPSGFIFFRQNPEADDTVDYLLVALSRGNAASPKGEDPTYFDNVYVDTAGANLSDPAGAWTLISDFNSEAELDKVTDVTNQVDSGAASTIVDGKWSANPGNVLEATSNLFAMLDLGVDLKAESLATAAPVTVFVEVTQPTVPDGLGGTRKAIVDAVWGLSNSDPDEVTTTTYNSFNAMQRINFGNDSYETRDINGEGSGAYFTIGQFTENVTYKIWMVVDYNLNVLQSYIQGGTEYPTQTQITGFDPSGFIFFRQNPEADDTVDYFLVALSRGNAASPKGEDPTYFDNVYVDTTGANLNDPVGETVVVTPKGPGFMGNYDIVIADDGQQWVDSGSWLGWVNVENYPVVYLLGLDNWAYVGDATMTGDKDASGAWVYVFR